MSAVSHHVAEVTFMQAEVLHPTAIDMNVRAGGIAINRIFDGGEWLFVVTVQHADGSSLACALREDEADLFAGMFADEVLAASSADTAPTSWTVQ